MTQKLALKLLFGVALTLGALAAPAQSQQTAAPQQAVAQASVQTCLTCHGGDPKVTAILQSPMAVMGDPRTPFAQGGCESCHGDASAHLAGKAMFPSVVFVGPHKSPVEVRNQVCQGCHQGDPMVINWTGSSMQRAGVACTDCHTAHAAKDPVMVKATQAEVCFTCHASQRADSFKYSHHPVREGLVACSDCHNPMGGPGDTKGLKEFTVNETCYNCHAEKRGPLLWEHQPVRENCMNCHTPHGSNEPRLLKARMQFLCSTCHAAETANHSGGAFGGARSVPPRGGPGNLSFNSALANQRACVNCHSEIHGSNSPAGAFFFR
jgi:DmsE family decaheme c-type cytochrome